MPLWVGTFVSTKYPSCCCVSFVAGRVSVDLPTDMGNVQHKTTCTYTGLYRWGRSTDFTLVGASPSHSYFTGKSVTGDQSIIFRVTARDAGRIYGQYISHDPEDRGTFQLAQV